MTQNEFTAALDLQRKIDRLEEQLETLRQTGGIVAVGNGNTSVMGGRDSICQGQLAVEIEQEIRELKGQRFVESTLIQRFIDKQRLDELHAKLLKYRYVDCMTWKNVSLRLGYDKRYSLKLHASALNKMTLDDTQ